MKFGQLIEYDIRMIVPEKPYTKWGGEIIPKPETFLKNENWAYFWINCLKVYTVGFLLSVQAED